MEDNVRRVSITMMTCIGRETLMGHFCTTRENVDTVEVMGMPMPQPLSFDGKQVRLKERPLILGKASQSHRTKHKKRCHKQMTRVIV